MGFFLCVWPSIDATSLYRGVLPELGRTSQPTSGTKWPTPPTFCKTTGMPREVAVFEAAFKAAAFRVFAPSLEEAPPTNSKAIVNFSLKDSKKLSTSFVFEFCCGLGTVATHHERFVSHYAEYAPHGMTVAVVDGADDDMDGDEAAKKATCEAAFQKCPSVPLLVLHFAHGLFCTQCWLWKAASPPVEFTVDIDGIAMQLTQDDQLEVGQRIAHFKTLKNAPALI